MIRSNTDLRGFHPPGFSEKIVISLYADNMTLFLSSKDNFDHIQEILDPWCKHQEQSSTLAKQKYYQLEATIIEQKCV